MRDFALLLGEVESARSDWEARAALAQWLGSAADEDAAWALHLLDKSSLGRLVSRSTLSAAAQEAASLPQWLFDECHQASRDLAEACALMVPDGPAAPAASLADWLRQWVLPLRGQPPSSQADMLKAAWARLEPSARTWHNRLVLGGLLAGSRHSLILSAAAQALSLPPWAIALRLEEGWSPSAEAWRSLRRPVDPGEAALAPREFSRSRAIGSALDLSDLGQWAVEWDRHGIQAQWVRDGGRTTLWSKEGALIGGLFSACLTAVDGLPDGSVLEGLIVPSASHPEAMDPLERRLKGVGREPAAECLFTDVLRLGGRDLSDSAWFERRAVLEELGLPASEVLSFARIEDLQHLRSQARRRAAHGLIFKLKEAPRTGLEGVPDSRRWRAAPFALRAALIYAQRDGDFTFGLRTGDEFVGFAKTRSGLSTRDLKEIDQVVRATVVERHGPVRVVRPTLVFEIEFDSLEPSARHKCGWIVKGATVAAWRRDLLPESCDSIQALAEAAAPRSEPSDPSAGAEA